MVNKQEFEEILKRRNAELILISNVQKALYDNRELEELVDIVGEGLREILSPEYLQISTFNLEKELESILYSVVKGKRKNTETTSFTRVSNQLLQTKQLLIINEKDTEHSGDSDSVTSRELQPKSEICVPVIAGHDVAGSISLRNELNEIAYDKSDLVLITNLADTIGVAIKKSKSENELQKVLTDLNAAQEQLIQQEKLATLGQLTAGIAHEIKNPLNFVNNFSDVSLELIEEAREKVRLVTEDRGLDSEKLKVKSEKEKSPFEGGSEHSEQGDDASSGKDNSPVLILEILDDIEANLRKIHEHGSRADNIVTSMLLHSKGGSGNPEPVNLNGLIRDYVNLAFHGMRAGLRPINVEIRYNLDETIREVPLVAEDFSRVILNLCNNAFDAMRDKLTADSRQLSDSPDQKYEPRLKIRTLQLENIITIEIEDNGSGIPDEIKDRILQPFFTTKKGTEGTGLGLSISRDIVKVHGGDLKIDSRSGNGSTFIITIPINQNIETG